MNKPNKPNQPFDDDIAELFDGQEFEVPAALDDHIRSMARAELGQNSAAPGSATLDLAKNDLAQKQSSASLTARYAPVFATAAVMVLAVALVPMLIDQSTSPETSSSAAIEPMATAPQSSIDFSAASSSDAANGLANTADIESAEERVKKRVRSADLERQTQGLIVTEEDVAERALMMESKMQPETPSAVSTIPAPTTALADSAMTITSDSHRVSQASWLEELNRLYMVEEQTVFLDELALFKKQYPAVDLKKYLPAEALKLEPGD